LKAEGRTHEKIPLECIETTDGTKLFILGTLKGLKSEAEKVRDVLETLKPKAVGIYIPKEEVEGLAEVVAGNIKEMSLSDLEECYAYNLSNFGEVQVPPPCIVETYRWTQNNDVPLLALDMSDLEYSNAFTECISTLELMRHSMRIKKIKKKDFKSSDAQTFVMEWDGEVNKIKGYRKLEGRRNKKMADNIMRMSRKFQRSLAIVEYERFPFILEELNSKN